MKIFLKWWLRASALLGGVVLVLLVITFLENDAETLLDKLKGLGGFALIIVGLAALLGVLFWFLEVYYMPWYSARVQRKLCTIFEGKALSENTVTFELGPLRFYAVAEFKLSLSQQGNAEIITFYVDREQVDSMASKPDFDYKAVQLNTLSVYQIHTTNSWGLKRARRRFQKQLGIQ